MLYLYIAPNGNIICERLIRKDAEGIGRGQCHGTIRAFVWRKRKTMKTQNVRCPDRYSNQEHHEYKIKVLLPE
jgi:hypothetical protein